MKLFRFTLIAASLILSATLYGCGGGNSGDPTSGSTSTYDASIGCFDCHGGSNSPVVVDAKIVDEWRNSNHNTSKSGVLFGASCIDCHEPQTGHPNVCSKCHGGVPSASNVTGLDVVRNPDEELKCFKCHHANSLSTSHFNNITSGSSYPAEFVTKNNVGKCRLCHNPHDVSKLMSLNKDWGRSGHGDVTAAPWTEQDFKSTVSSGSYACIRCHTATGFINFANNSFTTPFPLTTWATPGDKSHEVLSCNTCHTSYDFKNSVRKTKPFVAPYNNNASPWAFQDTGASNLCIACHSGRENSKTIAAVANFANSSFKNSHYIAAAGLMYMSTGFTNFTSAGTAIGTSTYGKSLTIDKVSDPVNGIAGGVTSTHRKFGTTAINGDSHSPSFFVPGIMDQDGPCVTCHMNATGLSDRGTSHTLGINANAYNQVCVNCHASEGSAAGPVALTAANFQEAFLEPNRAGFQNSLLLMQDILKVKYGIKYDPASYPYFYDLTKDPSGKTAATDWTRGTGDQVFGKRMMGACFNLNLLTKEPAAYAHARSYSRRLVYDSIDFLDDGAINRSVSATAVAYSLAAGNLSTGLFKKGANAYTDKTLGTIDSGTTEAMLYLLAWNRSTGAWNSPERP